MKNLRNKRKMYGGDGTKMHLVLDFDNTMTSVHSRGDPFTVFSGMDPNVVFGGELERLKSNLNLLVRQGWTIYVCSRGLKTSVQTYLQSLRFPILENNIFGAKNMEEVSYSDWHIRKTDKLYELTCKLGNEISVIRNTIVFIDDEIANVVHAGTENFRYTFVNKFRTTGLNKFLDVLSRIIFLNELRTVSSFTVTRKFIISETEGDCYIPSSIPIIQLNTSKLYTNPEGRHVFKFDMETMNWHSGDSGIPYDFSKSMLPDTTLTRPT